MIHMWHIIYILSFKSQNTFLDNGSSEMVPDYFLVPQIPERGILLPPQQWLIIAMIVFFLIKIYRGDNE